MIYAFLLILFFIYSTFIFFINSLLVLILLFLINVILFLGLNITFKRKINILKNNILFIIFIFLCNLIFCTLDIAFVTAFKILIVLILTFTISIVLTPSKFTEGIHTLLTPLKIFRINTKDIALIITIAIEFIPILSYQASEINKALLSKGFKFNIKNCFLKPHVYLITYLNGIFEQTSELEKSLIMKAFE